MGFIPGDAISLFASPMIEQDDKIPAISELVDDEAHEKRTKTTERSG
jgi:hypothetical protein